MPTKQVRGGCNFLAIRSSPFGDSLRLVGTSLTWIHHKLAGMVQAVKSFAKTACYPYDNYPELALYFQITTCQKSRS